MASGGITYYTSFPIRELGTRRRGREAYLGMTTFDEGEQPAYLFDIAGRPPRVVGVPNVTTARATGVGIRSKMLNRHRTVELTLPDLAARDRIVRSAAWTAMTDFMRDRGVYVPDSVTIGWPGSAAVEIPKGETPIYLGEPGTFANVEGSELVAAGMRLLRAHFAPESVS